jgi:hypothetical protein
MGKASDILIDEMKYNEVDWFFNQRSYFSAGFFKKLNVQQKKGGVKNAITRFNSWI